MSTEAIVIIAYLAFCYFVIIYQILNVICQMDKYPIVRMFFGKLFTSVLKRKGIAIVAITIVCTAPVMAPVLLIINAKDLIPKKIFKKKSMDLTKVHTPYIEAEVADFPNEKQKEQ